MKNFIRNISHRFFIIWAGLNAWALAATAEQESLLISKIIGEVSPKSHLELTSNTNGNITLLTPNNTSITQGSLLAWVNKEQMDLVKEIDELQDLQQKAKGSGTVVREIESVEKLRDTILQTQQELFFLENLLQSDDFELNEQELDITKKSIQLKSEFLKQFQASLEVYEQAIKNDSFTRLADLQKLVKDQESERRLAEFQLLSNGNGDLQWLVKNEQFVVSKQPVATITDASEIYIKIPSQAFEVTTRVGSNIYIQSTNHFGTITATFLKKERSDDSARAQINYVFKVDEDSKVFAKNYLFISLVFELRRHATGLDTLLLSKADAINRLPKSEIFLSWQNLINKYYPEYKLVDIGASQLLLRQKK